MLRLIYVSQAVGLNESDIDAILEKSIANNAKVDVTGCLLLNEGMFLQFLEGPQAAVQKTFEKIKKDPRHRDVEVLHAMTIETRVFHQWAMTFKPICNFNGFEAERIRRLFLMVRDPSSSLEILEFLKNVRSNLSLSLLRSA